MHKPRRRIAWGLRWAGTIGCALLLTVFITSGWWGVFSGAHREFKVGSARLPFCTLMIDVAFGAVRLRWDSAEPIFGGSGDRDQPLIPFWGAGRMSGPDFSLAGLPRFERSSASSVRVLTIPLWLPFLLLALPTAWLWRCAARPPPCHCRRCRYDLTGNTSGRCPECGAAAANAAG